MWKNKWVRIGLVAAILTAAFIVGGLFGGAVLGPGSGGGNVTPPVAPSSPAPGVSAPTPQPAPPVVNVNVNQNQTQTVIGNGTENENQSSQTTPTTPTPAPAATPVPPKATAQLIAGDFKASVYRQSDGWFLNSFREPVIDSSSGPLSRVEDVLVRWAGTFSAPTAGKYQFDYADGADLYVDGTRVIGPVYLAKGIHKLALGPLLLKPADGPVRLLLGEIS